ncbi:RNase H [Popillia japonica]|uniref:RNase H n=1 Tax=Popillia japonica TaxID=7064 RepID=A0AAW1JH89_POPJA
MLITSYYLLNSLDVNINQCNPSRFELSYESLVTPPKCWYLDQFVNSVDSHTINSEFRQLLLERWEEYYLIYTDGSGIEAAYGCAYYDKQREYTQSFRLKDTASVYTAELVAIYESLKYINRLNIQKNILVIIYESLKYINRLNIQKNILVISDCKSAIQKITSFRISKSDPLIINIYKEIANTSSTVEFLWVKGHCGISGNERVDVAAKEGCGLTETLEIPFCPWDTFNLLKKAMQNEFKEQFLTGTTGLFHKSLQQDDREKAWYANETNRNFIRTMSRLRSNHGICKSYLMKIKLADSDSCMCGSVETLEHLILTCPVYNDYRRIFFYKLTKLTEHPFNYNTLLGSNDTGIYKEIYKFLINCKISV